MDSAKDSMTSTKPASSHREQHAQPWWRNLSCFKCAAAPSPKNSSVDGRLDRDAKLRAPAPCPPEARAAPHVLPHGAFGDAPLVSLARFFFSSSSSNKLGTGWAVGPHLRRRWQAALACVQGPQAIEPTNCIIASTSRRGASRSSARTYQDCRPCSRSGKV